MPTPRAFTLIEVLIVVSLIAVFSVMAAVNYNSARRSIEFTTVFLNLTELTREMRNFAINSRVDGSAVPTRVPFAYAAQFKKDNNAFTATGFIDAYRDAAGKGEYYKFDLAPSGKDSQLQKYDIPSGYAMRFVVGEGLETLSTTLSDEVIIGFMPPYGDVYIADPKSGQPPAISPKLYKNAGIQLTSPVTGASKWLCTNSIGGVLEESLTGCLNQ